ncbi:Hsp70 protein [Saccharopolyspora erythraea NRRL 2338]|uniref:Hsp70 protein n=1 Tax=Saccharopolyspora erythraea TaxID=1836 RepID=A0ABP3NGB1_SACER|nr:Hsp70 family protein [Saccharopolyspora erythraea]EQD88097.1 molecular chaperone HscC [Saccharopolyspora erythraea D]PFG93445.1 Hsp70 protein [Saccharopolyspora erythraea NRRL 2338]QRK90317.1 Hsp70 family protein [Saccharopolyspora erythraea]
MPYVLGIHLGATATSAAIARREGGRWAAAAPVPLGSGSAGVPTVLCRAQDGSYLAGEQAQRQELTHHQWVARGFTRRVGEDAPLLVGNDFVQPHALAATMIEWVADAVAHRQGHPPEHIAVAHSANWGPHRTHVVHQALAQLGISDVTLLPEPVAVAMDYASKQRVDDGGAIAVGNIGGTGFDATVLRRRTPGFEVVGPPLDSPHPGGQDLDDALFEHIRAELGGLAGLDVTDFNVRATLAQLRGDCVHARETLSFHPGATLRIHLPKVNTDFAVSRSRFEKLARTHLERVPELVLQAVQSANLTPGELDAVVLAGGVARTPLLKQLVQERLERQPLVDGAPELVAACGAAVSAVKAVSTEGDQAASMAETSVLMRIEAPDDDPNLLDPLDDDVAESPRPPVEVEPMHIEPPDEKRQRLFKILKLTLAALLVIAGLIMTFYGTPSTGGLLGGAGGPAPQQQQR